MSAPRHAHEDAPFLRPDPPPWAARGLASVLIAVCLVGVTAAWVVQVPETVSGTFRLVPVRGADPIRAPRDGVVSAVNVIDAQAVDEGDLLFMVISDETADRSSERDSLERVLAGADARMANERTQYENQRRADEEELGRLRARLDYLGRQLALKRQQMILAREIADRQKRSYDEGLTSWMEASRPQLEADRLAVDVEQAETERADTAKSIERLAFEMRARAASYREADRSLREQTDRSRVRKTMLDRDPAAEGNQSAAVAPCGGTVLKRHVMAPGAVVQEGDLLAEIGCDDERLEAELTVPERGMALVREGQAVKLMYDAFPYQRYGVQYGTVRWISPASVIGREGPMFRALVALDAERVSVKGEPRRVSAGMGGRAAVIVGRRSVASYAFEPLRQLRESLADAPPRPGRP